jgi:hypothetical protein
MFRIVTVAAIAYGSIRFRNQESGVRGQKVSEQILCSNASVFPYFLCSDAFDLLISDS